MKPEYQAFVLNTSTFKCNLTVRDSELLRIKVIWAPRRLAACSGANRAEKDIYSLADENLKNVKNNT